MNACWQRATRTLDGKKLEEHFMVNNKRVLDGKKQEEHFIVKNMNTWQ